SAETANETGIRNTASGGGESAEDVHSDRSGSQIALAAAEHCGNNQDRLDEPRSQPALQSNECNEFFHEAPLENMTSSRRPAPFSLAKMKEHCSPCWGSCQEQNAKRGQFWRASDSTGGLPNWRRIGLNRIRFLDRHRESFSSQSPLTRAHGGSRVRR